MPHGVISRFFNSRGGILLLNFLKPFLLLSLFLFFFSLIGLISPSSSLYFFNLFSSPSSSPSESLVLYEELPPWTLSSSDLLPPIREYQNPKSSSSSPSLSSSTSTPTSPPSSSSSTLAIVTLAGSDHHIRGCRVLAKSINRFWRNSPKKADLVVLATSLVSPRNLRLLAEDGWRVLLVPTIQNPFFYDITIEDSIIDQNLTPEPESWFSSWFDISGISFSLLTQTSESRNEAFRMATIFAKLHIFGLNRDQHQDHDHGGRPSFDTFEADSLLNYELVLYLDADTFAVRDPSSLFEDYSAAVNSQTIKVNTNHIPNVPASTPGSKRTSSKRPTPVPSPSTSNSPDFVLAAYAERLMASSPRWEFNAGVLLIKPSLHLFDQMLSLARYVGSNQNRGDQGLLQRYFFYSCVENKTVGLEDLPRLERLYPDHAMSGWKDLEERVKDPLLCDKDAVIRDPNTQNPEVRGKKLWNGPVDYRGQHIVGCKRTPPQAQTLSSNKTGSTEPETGVEKREEKAVIETSMYVLVPKLFPLQKRDQRMGADEVAYTRSRFPEARVLTSSACWSLPDIYNLWIVDDRLGTRPDAVIVHFIDPENKPWDWRVWPYGGFFAQWLDLTDQIDEFWTDTFGASVSWILAPVVLGALVVMLRPLRAITNRLLFGVAVPLGVAVIHFLIPARLLPVTILWHCLALLLSLSSALAWQVPYKYLPAHFHPFVGWFLFCEYSTIFALGICGFFSFFLFCLGRTIPLPPSSRERLRKLKTPPSIGLFSFLPFGWVSVTGLSLGIWLLHVAMVAHVRTWGAGLWIEAATPHTMLPVHILLWLGLFLWPLNRLFVVCLQNGRRPEYSVLTSSAASSTSSHTGGHSHRASIRHHHHDSESLEESKVVDRGEEDDEFVDLLHPILLC